MIICIRVPEASTRNFHSLLPVLPKHDLHDNLVPRELEICETRCEMVSISYIHRKGCTMGARPYLELAA